MVLFQPFFSSPDFIASDPPSVSDDTPIDLVFVDFIQNQLLQILNTVQTAKTYTTTDVQKYTPFSLAKFWASTLNKRGTNNHLPCSLA